MVSIIWFTRNSYLRESIWAPPAGEGFEGGSASIYGLIEHSSTYDYIGLVGNNRVLQLFLPKVFEGVLSAVAMLFRLIAYLISHNTKIVLVTQIDFLTFYIREKRCY